MNKRQLFLRVLSRPQYGSLKLVTPDGRTHEFRGPAPGEDAEVVIKDWSVVDAVMSRADIGLGETYMEGLWDSPDLKQFLTFCTRNRDGFRAVSRFDVVNRLVSRAVHYWNQNSLAGSRRNMAASYDYPPELYQATCDRMMTYSSAWWDGKDMSFDDAQVNKYNRILSRIGPPPGHVLEMGCGWGYFLQLAASRGYTITGCTVSRKQYEYGRKLNEQAIADGRVKLVLDDYRNMPGRYDAVVSTGFFEHVGSAYWVEHFRKVKQYLKPGGVAMIQTMLVNHYDPAFGKRLNFMSKYIFPGGEFPSAGTFIVAAETAGLKCEEMLAFGQDYARTMNEFWNNFAANKDDVRKLGFDDRFLRKWEYFIAGWYAMFRSGNCNVMQAKLMHF